MNLLTIYRLQSIKYCIFCSWKVAFNPRFSKMSVKQNILFYSTTGRLVNYINKRPRRSKWKKESENTKLKIKRCHSLNLTQDRRRRRGEVNLCVFWFEEERERRRLLTLLLPLSLSLASVFFHAVWWLFPLIYQSPYLFCFNWLYPFSVSPRLRFEVCVFPFLLFFLARVCLSGFECIRVLFWFLMCC